MNYQKLSIITINLNNADGLYKTINSVLSQTYPTFEYIIIDGGSTDGSLELITKHVRNLTYWVSEPDYGIYNAMNKGIIFAKGEYCLFLNSGDWLVDNNVVSDFVNSIYNEDFIAGNLVLWNKGQTSIRNAIDKNKLGFENFYSDTILHPSTFIKRHLFDMYGLFNEKLKIVSDWEFFLKCIVLNNCSYTNFDRLISYFDQSGISSKQENQELISNERRMVLESNIPIFKSTYEHLLSEINYLRSIEKDHKEYLNLKNGKFRIIVNCILKLKEFKKHWYQ